MIKFIHTADIHLDSPLHRLAAYEGAPVEDVRRASRRAFANLIDLAVAEPVDFVLIAGDLFDGDWKDYHTGLYFVSQIQRLKTAGIGVYIVSGNHDAASQMTRRLPYPDNVHIFGHRKPETFLLDDLKVAIHGQSFARAAVTDNLARRYPDPLPGWFNIGLLHTSLTGREGHETYAPCTVEDLSARGYDYWALGHVHQFEIAAVDPPVVFPGCIQGRHIRETGVKGAALVSAAEGRAPEINHHSLDVVRWVQLAVDLDQVPTAEAGLDRLVTALAPEIRRHAPLPLVVRATFSGETAAHGDIAGDLAYWSEAVRSAAMAHFGAQIWIESVRVTTRPHQADQDPPADPGPLRELRQLVDEILADDSQLASLGDELVPLFRKLPAAYRQGRGALDPTDAGQMRRLVEEAQTLLARGLLKEVRRA
jgi:DNA repair exonuclease SbcCD nuclease subunit